ncbi:unnamed protein product [Mytilus edulis]|uniref:C-type lectin domain-containing protein n=2 Tax=Mytilus edulis TaxID=6550 RepID=A0A8S3RIK2_MYTED|nr:unnamed protein product [Mytilus edulis]
MEKKTVMCVLCIIYTTNTILNSFELRQQSYEIEINTKFVPLPTTKIVETSFGACASSCLSNGVCCAASYHISSKECYLVGTDYCYNKTEIKSDWKILRIKLLQKEYFEMKKTWNEAKEFCETWGGRLATVSSISENEYMIRRLGDATSIWLGGTDLKSEGTWVWNNYSQEETEKLIQPTFWGPNQPNNYYQDQHCLAFFKFYNDGSVWTLDGYAWDDEQCHLQFQFMCEK